MATPIGHAVAGYAVYYARPFAVETKRSLLLLAMLLSIVPDFDFIPGLLMNQPSRYHQGISHSFAAALVVSGLTTLWYGFVTQTPQQRWRYFSLFFLAYASHLLLDLFGPDGRPPYGIPLLWPLSDTAYLAPVTLLPGVKHGGPFAVSSRDWFGVVLQWRNLFAVGVELFVLAPILGLIHFLRRKRPLYSYGRYQSDP